MKLVINGTVGAFAEQIKNVAELLERPEWVGRLVIVELNGVIIGKDAYDSTLLSDGDRIELVHFVGGG